MKRVIFAVPSETRIRFPSGDQRGVSLSPSNSSSCSAFFLAASRARREPEMLRFAGQNILSVRAKPGGLRIPPDCSHRRATAARHRSHLPAPACCVGRFASSAVCRRACLVHLAAARVHDRFAIGRQPDAGDLLAVVAFVMRYLARQRNPANLPPRCCARLFVIEHPGHAPMHGTALVSGRRETARLSTCSSVKLSPRQTIGTNMLPRATTRNWSRVLNTMRIIMAER